MTRLQPLPIRWRLALTSAGLTFAILLLFALVIGVFTARQVRSSFDDDLRLTAVDLSERVRASPVMNTLGLPIQGDRVVGRAVAGDAVVRIVNSRGAPFPDSTHEPNLGPPRAGVTEWNGYRVVSRGVTDNFGVTVAYLQYGKPVSHLQ